MQGRARVQHHPIKSATTVLSEEQRPESRSEKESKREMGERHRESRLNSQIKEEWVREVFIHQKLQTPTHSFSSGLSVPWRSLMNWRAEGECEERGRGEEEEEEEPLHPLPPTPHHNYQPLKENIPACRAISKHSLTTQDINKSTKRGLFKHRVILAHSAVWEQKYVFR